MSANDIRVSLFAAGCCNVGFNTHSLTTVRMPPIRWSWSGFQARSGIKPAATANRRIYVGSIPWDMDAANIKQIFEAFGSISSCQLLQVFAAAFVGSGREGDVVHAPWLDGEKT